MMGFLIVSILVKVFTYGSVSCFLATAVIIKLIYQLSLEFFVIFSSLDLPSFSFLLLFEQLVLPSKVSIKPF